MSWYDYRGNLQYGVHAESVNLGEVMREDLNRLMGKESPLTEEEWEIVADNILGRVNNYLEEILEQETNNIIDARDN